MLFATVSASRYTSWNTTATCSASASGAISRTSCPPTRTLPLLASQNREIKLMTVVFPLPEGPTSAVRVPGCAVNVTPCSTSLPSAYPNRTSSNRTSKLVKRGLPSRYARGRSACIRSMPPPLGR